MEIKRGKHIMYCIVLMTPNVITCCKKQKIALSNFL